MRTGSERSLAGSPRLNAVTGAVIGSALKVHSALGPGLLESAYHACLAFELQRQGHHVRSQLPVPLEYASLRLAVAYRIDMLIDETVLLELKAVTKVLPIHHAQLLSYLKLSGYPAGLLINFHAIHLRDGIHRILNGGVRVS